MRRCMTVVDGSRTPAWIQARAASRNCLLLQTPRAARTEPTAPREAQSSAVRAYPPRPSPCRNTTVLGSIKWLRTAAGAEQIAGLGAMRHCFQKVTGGMQMSGWTRGSLFAALKAARVASILGWVLVLSAGPALADPDPAPGDPGVVAGPAAAQDPTPFTGTAPFGPPRIVPANGSTVGVAQPIIINFPGLVDDAGATES